MMAPVIPIQMSLNLRPVGYHIPSIPIRSQVYPSETTDIIESPRYSPIYPRFIPHLSYTSNFHPTSKSQTKIRDNTWPIGRSGPQFMEVQRSPHQCHISAARFSSRPRRFWPLQRSMQISVAARSGRRPTIRHEDSMPP